MPKRRIRRSRCGRLGECDDAEQRWRLEGADGSRVHSDTGIEVPHGVERRDRRTLRQDDTPGIEEVRVVGEEPPDEVMLVADARMMIVV